MQIAIDGPAGVGKSTAAKELAKRLKFTYLDTGAMYRAIAYLALKEGLEMIIDNPGFEEIAQNSVIRFDNEKIFINDEDVTKQIRTPEVSEVVSVVAANKKVREILQKEQQEIAYGNDVIMDGRDIGSAVLPDADYKLYLDASPMCRAKRRALEIGIDPNNKKGIEEIAVAIKERDIKDMSREASPLVKADDAIVIMTDELNAQEVVDKILGIIGGQD